MFAHMFAIRWRPPRLAYIILIKWWELGCGCDMSHRTGKGRVALYAKWSPKRGAEGRLKTTFGGYFLHRGRSPLALSTCALHWRLKVCDCALGCPALAPEFPPGISSLSDSDREEIKVEIQEPYF